MGLKQSCVALDVTYINQNDKYKKIENVYTEIKNFQHIKRLNIDLTPSDWLEKYRDSEIKHKSGTSYEPFYYSLIDKAGEYEERKVWIWAYAQSIRFWIGDNAMECLDWEHELFEALLKNNNIDTVLILIPSKKCVNLVRGKLIGKKNLLILDAIKRRYRGNKKDILKFLKENEDQIYKNDQIISVEWSNQKELLRQEKNGFFLPLIRQCFLFRDWF
jgi:hypothetical protein